MQSKSHDIFKRNHHHFWIKIKGQNHIKMYGVILNGEIAHEFKYQPFSGQNTKCIGVSVHRWTVTKLRHSHRSIHIPNGYVLCSCSPSIRHSSGPPFGGPDCQDNSYHIQGQPQVPECRHRLHHHCPRMMSPEM